MSLLETVKQHWAWSSVVPLELVVSNDFGNLILKDEENRFWRLSPEDVYCKVVADSIEAYNKLIQNEEFLEDWHMIVPLSHARKGLGVLEEGEAYGLKTPGVLGGDYIGSNVIKVPLLELIASAGRLGQHIADQPEGVKIDLNDVNYLDDVN